MKIAGNKKLIQLLLAILVLIVVFVFVNQGSYNAVKSLFVPEAQKYLEMKAYSNAQVGVEKYFILQDNSYAKSYLEDSVKFIEESDLGKVIVQNEAVYIHEKDSRAVADFFKINGGERKVLNKGSEIEFFSGAVQAQEKSCKIGG